MLRLLFSIVRNVISVSKFTSLLDCSLRVFFNCHCLCLFVCQVMSPQVCITLTNCLKGHKFLYCFKCLCHYLCLPLSLSQVLKIKSWIYDSLSYTLQSCLRVSDTVTVCGQIKMTKWQMSRVEYNMVYMLKNDGRQ